MDDPRPFEEDKFRRESENRVVHFIANFDAAPSVSAGELSFDDRNMHATLVRVFSRLVGRQSSGGENLEHFHFLLRCTGYPFLGSNIVFMHKNSKNQKALLAAVLWLVDILVYERACTTVLFSKGDSVAEFYRRVKVLYADFLQRGVELKGTNSNDIFLSRKPSSRRFYENLMDKNRHLRDIVRNISQNKTRRDASMLRKTELLAKLRRLQDAFTKALEGAEILQSHISQLKIAISYLQFERAGVAATTSATKHRFGSAEVTVGQASDTSVRLETSASSRVSSVSEVSRSLQQKSQLLSRISCSLHLPSALVELFQPRYIRDSTLSGESLKLKDELVVSLQRETSRAAGTFHSTVEKLKDLHSTLERIALERDNQRQKLDILEQLLRRAEEEYQSERHIQDEQLHRQTETVREMEKSTQALTSEQKIHTTVSVENIRNMCDDVDRSFASDKAAVQNRLWLVLDLLMSHKQRNHEIFDGWSCSSVSTLGL